MNLQINPETYTSVIIWQGEPEWLIEVRISGFATIEAAAEFGNKHAKKLKHEPNADYLVLLDSSGCNHRVEQHQIIVKKIKNESLRKLMVNAHDFTVVDVRIEDFSNIDGLDRGFEGLAYGILDSNSVKIEPI